jgi:hypothetical protein
MRFINLAVSKFPMDNVFVVAYTHNSIYNVYVQRFDDLKQEIASKKFKLNKLNQKIQLDKASFDDFEECERLDDIFFNLDFHKNGARYIISGNESNELRDLKELIKEKSILRLERYGNLDEFFVSSDGQNYEVSESLYKKYLMNFGSHINSMLSRVVSDDVVDPEIRNQKLEQLLNQETESFYAIYYGFPNAHVTFHDRQGKRLFYDSGAFPNSTSRQLVPVLEKSDTSQNAITLFSEERDSLISEYRDI